jgi:uncharacterized protein with PQ loop repeat
MNNTRIIKVNKTIYYYFILFAILLFSFSFIPIVYEVIQQKITSNIPYVSLICLIISYLIFIFITIQRNYFVHLFFYIIGLICLLIILFLKAKYDKNNIKLFGVFRKLQPRQNR